MLNFVPVDDASKIDTMCEIASRIWHDHYTPILGAAQVEYMVDKFQSPHAVTAQIRDSGYHYYLMDLDGQYAGFMGIQYEPQSLFLSKLYVDKPFRRQHLASRAVDSLKADCAKRGLSKIWLTVNRENAGSIAAYRKLGFRKVREEKTDIGHGYFMDDYIMELYL